MGGKHIENKKIKHKIFIIDWDNYTIIAWRHMQHNELSELDLDHLMFLINISISVTCTTEWNKFELCKKLYMFFIYFFIYLQGGVYILTKQAPSNSTLVLSLLVDVLKHIIPQMIYISVRVLCSYLMCYARISRQIVLCFSVNNSHFIHIEFKSLICLINHFFARNSYKN